MNNLTYIGVSIISLLSLAIGYFWKTKVDKNFCNLKHEELDRRIGILFDEIKTDIKELKHKQENFSTSLEEIKEILLKSIANLHK